MAQWLRLQIPNAEGPSSVPDKETRSHMLHAAMKIEDPEWKSSYSTTKNEDSECLIKIQHSQTNK